MSPAAFCCPDSQYRRLAVDAIVGNMTSRDPFAEVGAAQHADPAPLILDQGATVLTIEQHPAYGRYYRCKAWMAQYPWHLDRKAEVTIYRGDPLDNPQKVGAARTTRLRRNGQDVQTVPVGFTSPEPEIEVWLEGDAEVQVGDILTFGDPA
jgi:hypothetical protein